MMPDLPGWLWIVLGGLTLCVAISVAFIMISTNRWPWQREQPDLGPRNPLWCGTCKHMIDVPPGWDSLDEHHRAHHGDS